MKKICSPVPLKLEDFEPTYMHTHTHTLVEWNYYLSKPPLIRREVIQYTALLLSPLYRCIFKSTKFSFLLMGSVECFGCQGSDETFWWKPGCKVAREGLWWKLSTVWPQCNRSMAQSLGRYNNTLISSLEQMSILLVQ